MSVPGECILFDAGGERSQMSERLLKLIEENCGEKQLKLIISHFDKDHLIKTFQLLKYFLLKEAFVPYLEVQKPLAKSLIALFRQRNVPVRILKIGKEVLTRNYIFEILGPKKVSPQQPENNNSLVIRARVGEKIFLLTGDSPISSQLRGGETEVLKVSHHGSRYNTSKKLVAHLKPKICILSNGLENEYGHPHQKTLLTLTQIGCLVLRTDQLGTIVFEL